MLMRLGSILFALPAIVLLVLYGIELSTVSDCTDQSLFFDYVTNSCIEQKTEQSSYYHRNSTFVDLMLLLSAFGSMLMIWGMLAKGMSRPKD